MSDVKVVPVEPTGAMLEAATAPLHAAIASIERPAGYYPHEAGAAIYRAMLSAAPVLSLEGGLSEADAKWLADWLTREKDGGHCGEGVFERRERASWNERIDRCLQSLAIIRGGDQGSSAQEADPHRAADEAVLADEQPKRFVIYWLENGALPDCFLSDLNGYITGGSGRCREAVEASGAMIFEKVSDLPFGDPQPETANRAGQTGPGGWLVKDFADGWYWTGDRLNADMAANGGACVFDITAGEYETRLPAAPEAGS